MQKILLAAVAAIFAQCAWADEAPSSAKAVHGLMLLAPASGGLHAPSDTTRYWLYNPSGQSIGPASASVSGKGFSLAANGCSKSLAPKSKCPIDVRWAKGSMADSTGLLRVHSGGIELKSSLRGQIGLAPAAKQP